MSDDLERRGGGDDPSFLVLLGDGLDWGVDARCVREILFERDWDGPPAVDVGAPWGVALVQSGRLDRVVVVETEGGRHALRASSLAYLTVQRSEVLAMPLIHTLDESARFVSAVVLLDSRAPLIVLEPGKLAGMTRDRSKWELLRRTPSGGSGDGEPVQ